MGRFKSLFSLSNGNANVHPSGSGLGRACVRRTEERRGGGYFTEKGRQIEKGYRVAQQDQNPEFI